MEAIPRLRTKCRSLQEMQEGVKLCEGRYTPEQYSHQDTKNYNRSIARPRQGEREGEAEAEHMEMFSRPLSRLASALKSWQCLSRDPYFPR